MSTNPKLDPEAFFAANLARELDAIAQVLAETADAVARQARAAENAPGKDRVNYHFIASRTQQMIISALPNMPLTQMFELAAGADQERRVKRSQQTREGED